MSATEQSIETGGGGGISSSLPKERYIYLVQDANDVALIGSNAYTEFQAAYNAANALQLLLGGTNRVVISVGNTTAAAVGNLQLTANWNVNVSIDGLSAAVSEVGDIIATNALGNGFTVGGQVIAQQAKFSNVKIGNIITSSTGTTGNAGTVGLLLENAIIGDVNTSVANVSNLTGNGGSVRIGFNTNVFSYRIGSILTSSKSTTTNAGSVNITSTSGSISIASITTANNNLGGVISVATRMASIGNVTLINSTLSATVSSFTNATIGLITYTGPSITFENCYNQQGLVFNALAATSPRLIFERCNFGSLTLSSNYLTQVIAKNSNFISISNLGDNSILSNSIIDTFNTSATHAINEYGSNIQLNGCVISAYGGNNAIFSSIGNIIGIENTNLNGGVSGAVLKKIIGNGAVTDNIGVFDFDGAVLKSGTITLNGSNSGSNTLNLLNMIYGEVYEFIIINGTGTDTLTLNCPNGLLTEGGAYTPTPSAGAVDRLSVLIEENGSAFVSVKQNFS